MVLPALGEGTFTVVNETLDIRQTVVSTSTYHFIVDTTPPRYKSIYPSQNAGYDMVLSGPLWELGRGGSGQFSIFADGIEDASGIAKIRLVIKRSNGSVVSDNNLSYDTANKRAFYPWIKDMNTRLACPQVILMKNSPSISSLRTWQEIRLTFLPSGFYMTIKWENLRHLQFMTHV